MQRHRYQRRERRHRLLERRAGIVLVRVVEVDRIGPEPRQRRVRRGRDVRGAQALAAGSLADLRRDHEVVPAPVPASQRPMIVSDSPPFPPGAHSTYGSAASMKLPPAAV